MRKKTLTILTLFSLALFLVGLVGLSVFLMAMHCFTPKCSSLPEWTWGDMILVAAGVFQLIAWIGAMIKQMKQRQWAWFVCTFLFSPICTWIYLLVVPESPDALVPAYTQPEQSVYKPYAQGYGVSQSANAQPGISQESGQPFQYVKQQQQHEDLMTLYPQE